MDNVMQMTKRRRVLIFGLLILSFAFGCGLPEPRPVVDKGADGMSPEAILQKGKKMPAPGPPPFSEKLEPVSRGLEKETKLYTLVFDAAPLGAVINALSRDTDLNLSVESDLDLSRPITVNLKAVTLKEALDMVVRNGAGYAWVVAEGNLSIKRFEERIYHLDYLDLSGATDIQVGGDMLTAGVAGSGVAGKFTVKVEQPVENTDVWSRLTADLEVLKSEAGVLRVNRNAGVIYMADTPRTVTTMVRYLDSLSEALHRQVFLEAKIMEVRLSDVYKYGIDWSAMNVAFRSSTSSMPDSLNIEFNSGGSIAKATQSSLSFILDFLRTQGDVSVLSNPHMFVMNGRSAVMTVGFQFPYGDVDGVERDQTTGVVTFGTSIKRTVLGLQMGITPQISGDGYVTLNIVPTITRIQSEQDVELPTSTDTKQTISNPIIDLQELSTTVRVREGEAVVLAGLISQIKALTQKGLPWFSKIPGLKYFFHSAENESETRELVIFITPYIKK